MFALIRLRALFIVVLGALFGFLAAYCIGAICF